MRSRTRPSENTNKERAWRDEAKQLWTFIVIVTFDLLRTLLRMRAYEQTDKDNYTK